MHAISTDESKHISIKICMTAVISSFHFAETVNLFIIYNFFSKLRAKLGLKPLEVGGAKGKLNTYTLFSSHTRVRECTHTHTYICTYIHMLNHKFADDYLHDCARYFPTITYETSSDYYSSAIISTRLVNIFVLILQ